MGTGAARGAYAAVQPSKVMGAWATGWQLGRGWHGTTGRGMLVRVKGEGVTWRVAVGGARVCGHGRARAGVIGL